MGPGILFLSLGIVIFHVTIADECRPTFVDCYCESYFENFVQVPVNTSLKKDPQTGALSCKADEFAPEVCRQRKCILIPNENYAALFPNKTLLDKFHQDQKSFFLKKGKKFSPNGSYSKDIKTKRSIKDHIVSQMLEKISPIEIQISPKDKDIKDRVKRNSFDTCEIPQLDNSEITCWKWPHWITCNQECIYGHGLQLDRGTVRKTSINCRDTENKWKPHSIKDCKPFINCKAHLVSPGDLNCVQTTKTAPYCEIRCDEYDDHPAVGLRKYSCQTKLDLPHCATLDESVHLIGAP